MSEYASIRSTVGTIGGVLAYVIVLSALLQLVAAWKGGSSLSRVLAGMTAAITMLAFSLVALLHARIGILFPLVEPFSGKYVGSYAIPPWIENERILFWMLLLAVAALIISIRKHRSQGTEIGVAMLLVAMAAATATVSSPFTPPLPGLHSELSAYVQAVSTGDPNVVAGAFGRTYGKMIGYYNSAYMWIHPPLLFISYAAVAITFSASIMALRGDMHAINIAYSGAKAGFLSLTLGLLLGYPWALQAWDGLPWWWDPKVSMSLMQWVLLAAYLHARIYRGRSPGMAALTHWLGIATFAALMATYLSTYIIPGIHATAQ